MELGESIDLFSRQVDRASAAPMTPSPVGPFRPDLRGLKVVLEACSRSVGGPPNAPPVF